MKNTRLLSRLLFLCAAVPLVACSSDKSVNIGNTTPIGSRLSDYAASWDGYAEAYTFMPDGTDRVRLTIASDGHGTLQIGNLSLLAPATDPNVGYPAGASVPVDLAFRVPAMQEGFLYPIYSAQVQTDRIQVGIKSHDYYSSWCGLQTPFAYVPQPLDPDAGVSGGYVLVLADGGMGGADTVYLPCPFQSAGASTSETMCYGKLNSSDQIPVDCLKLYLCQAEVCACTADGCGTSPVIASGSAPSQYPVELDAALDNNGQTLTGTLALSTDVRLTVVLQKQ